MGEDGDTWNSPSALHCAPDWPRLCAELEHVHIWDPYEQEKRERQ